VQPLMPVLWPTQTLHQSFDVFGSVLRRYVKTIAR
jgi:hypothetical protein